MTNSTKDEWMQKTWRPAMGWVYMVTCITDFILFPIMWSILQAAQDGQVTSQWNPVTLQGAGLFHLAMGAILGVAAYSRGKEKLAGVAGRPYQPDYSEYEECDYNSRRYSQPMPYNTGRTFTTRQGKTGPVIEEPEL